MLLCTVSAQSLPMPSARVRGSHPLAHTRPPSAQRSLNRAPRSRRCPSTNCKGAAAAASTADDRLLKARSRGSGGSRSKPLLQCLVLRVLLRRGLDPMRWRGVCVRKRGRVLNGARLPTCARADAAARRHENGDTPPPALAHHASIACAADRPVTVMSAPTWPAGRDRSLRDNLYTKMCPDGRLAS